MPEGEKEKRIKVVERKRKNCVYKQQRKINGGDEFTERKINGGDEFTDLNTLLSSMKLLHL